MNDIQSYIEQLKIKKATIGGFDKEAVYTAMQELCSMYQKEILQYKAEREQLETAYKTAADKLEQANTDIRLLKFQLEEEQKSQKKYELRFCALTQAIDAVNANKEEIIEEARKTAEWIIAEANEKSDGINQEYLLQKQQKDLVLSEIIDIKQQFNVSTDNLHSMLTKMLMDVEYLQKDSFWQTLGGNEIYHLVPMMTGSAIEHES